MDHVLNCILQDLLTYKEVNSPYIMTDIVWQVGTGAVTNDE